MAIRKQLVFSFKEIAELLVKEEKEIKEGHWGIFVKFGLQGSNIESESGLLPAAIVPLIEMGLQPFDKPTSLTVDAAEVRKKYDRK